MIGILLEDAYYERTWQPLFNAFLGEIIICRLEVDGGRSGSENLIIVTALALSRLEIITKKEVSFYQIIIFASMQ